MAECKGRCVREKVRVGAERISIKPMESRENVIEYERPAEVARERRARRRELWGKWMSGIGGHALAKLVDGVVLFVLFNLIVSSMHHEEMGRDTSKLMALFTAYCLIELSFRSSPGKMLAGLRIEARDEGMRGGVERSARWLLRHGPWVCILLVDFFDRMQFRYRNVLDRTGFEWARWVCLWGILVSAGWVVVDWVVAASTGRGLIDRLTRCRVVARKWEGRREVMP